MKKLKYEILFIILFMTIGIAAVTSNITIKGTTPIAANTDDFDVYFSDVYFENSNSNYNVVLGIDKKSFQFSSTFQNIDETANVVFEITNASKNYDIC